MLACKVQTHVLKLVTIYGMASLRCDRSDVLTLIGLWKDTFSMTTDAWAMFAWLVLEATAGVVWEENIVGWLVLEAAAGLVWEKNTTGWLETAGAEQGP